MAKLNEENLSKLSKKGLYEKLKTRGSKSKGKIYRFKKATPEMLAEIRMKLVLENKNLLRRNIVIGSICFTIAVFLFWLIFNF